MFPFSRFSGWVNTFIETEITVYCHGMNYMKLAPKLKLDFYEMLLGIFSWCLGPVEAPCCVYCHNLTWAQTHTLHMLLNKCRAFGTFPHAANQHGDVFLFISVTGFIPTRRLFSFSTTITWQMPSRWPCADEVKGLPSPSAQKNISSGPQISWDVKGPFMCCLCRFWV